MTDWKKANNILAMLVSIGLMSAPVCAQTSYAEKKPGFIEKLLPFLFEEEDTGPKPEDTMQAPFIEKGAIDTTPSQQLGIAYKPYEAPENAIALDQAHRQPAQIEQWTGKVISDSLDFDPLRYDSHLQTLNATMTPYAQDAFKSFLAKDNLLEALKANDLVMRAFVTEPAHLLNKGAVQGRYRWLVETPVTISFLPRGTQDYTGIQPKSQRINVRTQIGRVEQGGIDGVIMETLEFVPVASK